MIMRFIIRSLGLMLIATGFVSLVIDGTKAIANSAFSFTNLAHAMTHFAPQAAQEFEMCVTQKISPVIWSPVLTSVLALPVSFTSIICGLLMIWFARNLEEPVGFTLRG
jgi:hypothetical protein